MILASILILGFVGVQESFAEENFLVTLEPLILRSGHDSQILTIDANSIIQKESVREDIPFEIQILKDDELIATQRHEVDTIKFSILLVAKEGNCKPFQRNCTEYFPYQADEEEPGIMGDSEIKSPFFGKSGKYEIIITFRKIIPSCDVCPAFGTSDPITKSFVFNIVDGANELPTKQPNSVAELSTLRSISGNYVLMEEQFGYNNPYTITNGTINKILMDCGSNTLEIDMNSNQKGKLEIEISKEMMWPPGGGFLDNQGIKEAEFKDDKVTIWFPANSKKLIIHGGNSFESTYANCEKIHNPPYSYILSPLKQMKNGVEPKEMRCKDNLTLVPRNDGSTACVKQESFSKLIERGWTKLADALNDTKSYPMPTLP